MIWYPKGPDLRFKGRQRDDHARARWRRFKAAQIKRLTALLLITDQPQKVALRLQRIRSMPG